MNDNDTNLGVRQETRSAAPWIAILVGGVAVLYAGLVLGVMAYYWRTADDWKETSSVAGSFAPFFAPLPALAIIVAGYATVLQKKQLAHLAKTTAKQGETSEKLAKQARDQAEATAKLVAALQQQADNTSELVKSSRQQVDVALLASKAALEQAKAMNEQLKQNDFKTVAMLRRGITERELDDPELLLIYQREDFPDLVTTRWELLDINERKQYLHMGVILSHIELVFILKETLPEDYRASEMEWLDEIIATRMFERIWPYARKYYRPSFADHVDGQYNRRR